MSGRRSDTRERIQQVALELFVDQGYEKTSPREIAERLDVTKAALYYHFKTKEDILRAVLEDSAEDVDELVAWAQAQAATVATRQQFLRRYAGLLGGRWRLFMRFLQENQPALRDLGPQADFGRRMRTVVQFVASPTPTSPPSSAASSPWPPSTGPAPTIPGMEVLRATPEEGAAAALDIALELVSALRTVTVAAITSNLRYADLPGNVMVPGGRAGLGRDSVVNVSKVATLDRADLGECVGRLDDQLLAEVDRGLRLALSL